MSIYSGWWRVAYRPLPSGSVLNDKSTPFTVIRNNISSFTADPFVFEYDGKAYIFAEIGSVIKTGAMIGYSVFDGKKFSKWKVVIKEPFHLSFPNIFTKGGEIFIVPESFQSRSLYVYRAVKFPDVWVRCEMLLSDLECVDSVFVNSGSDKYLFTYEINGESQDALYKYRMLNDKVLRETREFVKSDPSDSRPAGNFFKTADGTLFRVAQDCVGSYGTALVFNKVTELSEHGYSEEQFQKLSQGDIVLSKNIKYSGIHTYNGTDRFEVIDLKWQIIHPLSLPYKFVHHFIRLFKKKKRYEKKSD
ncbi:MAG: hypothetical protein IKN38_08275 [Clostridia bacterium]|nr:hypothetical protein [Clostridia bacterium]